MALSKKFVESTRKERDKKKDRLVALNIEVANLSDEIASLDNILATVPETDHVSQGPEAQEGV